MIRVYQIWAVTRPINTLNRDSTKKNKNKLGLRPQLTWHPFPWPLHTQQWKLKWQLLTLSQVHQSFSNDIQGCSKIETKENGLSGLKVKNLWTFFQPRSHGATADGPHGSGDCGDIYSHWVWGPPMLLCFHGLMDIFWTKIYEIDKLNLNM